MEYGFGYGLVQKETRKSSGYPSGIPVRVHPVTDARLE
jgi:hypothetical protein